MGTEKIKNKSNGSPRMTHFPSEIHFCHPWRPYQKRILDELAGLLDDQRLHVIAPPGSGKTVLGLEVVRRLDRPALILSPTLTIRDQWVQRFTELFMSPSNGIPDWISLDIQCPGFLTSTTYQALCMLYKKDRNLKALESADLGTLVLDEAHHLRNEWWVALTRLTQTMKSCMVVSLTATPPYDVSAREWERYKTLCGPVDAEINVPELVFEKNLAPHQDYVWFCLPREDERRTISEFRNAVAALMDDLFLDIDFLQALLDYPWVLDPESHMDAIYDHVACFSAILIYLNHTGKWTPHEGIRLLGVEQKRIPSPDPEWMELLLTHVLFEDRLAFHDHDKTLSRILRRLDQMGCVSARKVHLKDTARIGKLIRTSAGKLDAILEIVTSESQSLGDDLRLAILTDFIHANDIPKAPDAVGPLNRLGVGSIFEQIRRQYLWGVRPGVLCGTLVIIPESAIADFQILAVEKDLPLDGFRLSALECDPGFVVVQASNAMQWSMVPLVTELFRLGRINVLVGTKSLLGEGWDAPWINCLIIASGVGSWVLSNQIRGRAIRTDMGNPDKTANIWHLVTVEVGSEQLGSDMDAMTRRFKAFVGLCHHRRLIANGIERLDMEQIPQNLSQIQTLNQQMLSRALDRDAMKQAWNTALKKGITGNQMVPAVRAKRENTLATRVVIQKVTVKLGLYLGLVMALGICLMMSGWNMANGPDPLTVGLGVAVAVLLPWALKTMIRHVRLGSEGVVLLNSGNAVMAALLDIGKIRSSPRKLKVEVEKQNSDTLSLSIHGATCSEQNYFLDAMEQILAPVDNPRYLIATGKTGRTGSRQRYIAVPEIFGTNKELALVFLANWQKHMEPAKLIYTRNPLGRKELIKARLTKLGSGKPDRFMVWK